LISQGVNVSASDPLLNGCSVISRLSHSKDPNEQAQDLYKGYLLLSEQLGLGHPSQDQRPRSFYNLLLTPEWMAMVRRRTEGAAGFSINALGFAGYLLATANSDLNWLKTNGPEALLREVILEFRGNTVVESSP
jgi:sulfate adenylyltransferase (ADP) / ATP adenylyltransferase